MVAKSTSIDQADADAVRAAGWSDEALYDAITVCALFQFYNNWIDATGVSDMPEVGYETSGRRLASHGYWMESNVSDAKTEARGPTASIIAD